MKRIAIIGGGIAGLSAAYYLEKQRRAGAALEYVLFERADRLGGVLVTDHLDGCIVEAGPDSFITEKPWATTLARELGLGDQIIGSNDADRKTFIVVKNRLVELPDGLMFMVPTKIMPTMFSRLFSVKTKLRMALEFLHAPHKLECDESVAAMVERHFGQEMVDRLADPLLSGIYGGECRDLSVRAVLSRFVEMEQNYGSLTRAMLAARKRMASMSAGKAKPPLFSSMKDGMQQLVDSLVDAVDGKSIRMGVEIAGVRYAESQQQAGEKSGTWQVTTGEGSTEKFDAVILSTPAHVMGTLLAGAHPELASELGGIHYSSSITCNLIYDRRDLAGKDKGFGFLVPRSEKRRMLACTFVHNKFPHRAPADKGIVRAFLGGAADEQVLEWTDDQIISAVRRDLREIAGIDAEPRLVRLYRWRRCMAQPSPGHLERIARIEDLRKQLPGLALAGNAFHGIGVPDCVRTGMHAAEHVGIPQSASLAALP
jgi:protoporphyrinogen/coproporphyrinogen III oxidase